jgi:hypothetical protein
MHLNISTGQLLASLSRIMSDPTRAVVQYNYWHRPVSDNCWHRYLSDIICCVRYNSTACRLVKGYKGDTTEISQSAYTAGRYIDGG